MGGFVGGTILLFSTLVLVARSSPVSQNIVPKTLEGVLRYDYATNSLNATAESVEDFESLYRVVRYQPRHIHISYGDNPFDIVVTWSTVDNPNETIVGFGREFTDERVAYGTAEEFISSGVLQLRQYIHRVILTGLEPGQRYTYHCGSSRGWSSLFFFTTMRNGTDGSIHLAVFGDLGADNSQSLSQLQKEVHLGQYDAIIHDGDFAYNMESENGLVGDVFMEDIQSMAAYVPYMTVPGNHENAENFRQYRRRFSMPGTHDSMYYSWNMGPVHFIGINTEVYFEPLSTRNDSVWTHYNWLEADLQEATSPEARSDRPWIILYGHQPMYCTNLDPPECLENTYPIRIGYPDNELPGLEELLLTYGVDLAIWAHEHSYERMFPLYDAIVYNGSIEEPYRNPGGLTHIITGSAGCKWAHDPFPETMPPWSGFRTTDYGYSRMRVINSTHLYFEQVSIDQGNQVIDSFTLVRERHDAYGPFYTS